MRRLSGWAAAAAVVLLGLAAAVFWLERPPVGVVEPAWDRDACGYCRMHVSEPAFAAEIQTADGEIVFFDDPGCLFLWQEENHAAARATFFHHYREDRWLSSPRVGFAPTAPTPMAWGLGAVDADAPGAIGLDEARRRTAALAAAKRTAGAAADRADAPR
ncbi:MAG: hypothetical protein ABI689_05650 [Thermoanaerobaculia bacterium]